MKYWLFTDQGAHCCQSRCQDKGSHEQVMSVREIHRHVKMIAGYAGYAPPDIRSPSVTGFRGISLGGRDPSGVVINI